MYNGKLKILIILEIRDMIKLKKPRFGFIEAIPVHQSFMKMAYHLCRYEEL